MPFADVEADVRLEPWQCFKEAQVAFDKGRVVAAGPQGGQDGVNRFL